MFDLNYKISTSSGISKKEKFQLTILAILANTISLYTIFKYAGPYYGATVDMKWDAKTSIKVYVPYQLVTLTHNHKDLLERTSFQSLCQSEVSTDSLYAYSMLSRLDSY